MFRLILTILIMILATFCNAAEAADYTFSASDYEAYTKQGKSDPNEYAPKPPVAGGPVTGQFLEARYKDGVFTHFHEGLDIGVDDIGIYAPVDGTVWHGSGNGFGDGWVYFVSDDDAYSTKIRMFVGDLNAETASMPSGVHVSRGDQIGYVLGYDPTVSNGGHPHFQFYNQDPDSPYAPFLHSNGVDENGNVNPGVLINPYHMLTALGSDLSGAVDYSGPRAGETGADEGHNTSLTVASLEYVGNLLNKIVKDWTKIATESIGSITPYALSIISALCIIDLSLPLALGMFSSFNPNQLILKILRYTSIIGLIIYWPEFINNILISFIETFISTAYRCSYDAL